MISVGFFFNKTQITLNTFSGFFK